MDQKDIVISKLTPADYPLFDELLAIYEENFGLIDFVKPPSGYLEQLLHHPNILFWVARHDEKVIGGLTAYFLPSVYQPSGEMYIYDLAIKAAYQRKGVGTLLMRALQDFCTRSGIKEIFVQADRPDKHAIDFYTKLGGIPEDVIHFSFPCQTGNAGAKT